MTRGLGSRRIVAAASIADRTFVVGFDRSDYYS